MLRTLVLLLMAGSMGSAATIVYDIEIDTSVTGPQASLLLMLFDNDLDVATELKVTNVKGIAQNGWSFQTGNVEGAFAEGDNNILRIWDGYPSFQYVNGYLELFAIFDSILKFTMTFTTQQVPNDDLALFAMKGGDGVVIDLFEFNSTAGFIVYENQFVSASSVSLAEPPNIAELLLLLGFVVGVGVIRQRRQGGADHSAMSRVTHFD